MRKWEKLSGWELDIASVGCANLAIGAAALISSITGFGYALLAIPVLVIFLAPQVVVPMVLMSWMPLSLLLAREAYGDIAWSKVGQWLSGAVPVVLFGLIQGWDYRVLRGCLIAYFTVLHALTIAVLGNFGMVNGLTLGMAVGVLPGMFIGYLIGIRLKERIDGEHLRTLTLVVVSLAGLAAIIRH